MKRGYLQGTCRAELVTADWSGFCRFAGNAGIPLWDLEETGDLQYVFTVNAGDDSILRPFCEKRGDRLRILGRSGLPGMILKVLHRPVLLTGILTLILLFLFLPTRILFIRVSGNHRVPTQRILYTAAENGLQFGTSRKDFRSERLKNRMLEKMPELCWVGVNTYGCVAEISVREQKLRENEPDRPGISGIIALRDGIIESCRLRSGELLCAPGQAVEKGQLLIAPHLSKGQGSEPPDGDVFALTVRRQTAVTPDSYLLKEREIRASRAVSVLIGKKRINIYGSSGNEPPVCDRIYKEYWITLPGGWQLPWGFTLETVLLRELHPVKQDPEECRSSLQKWSARCLRESMAAGQILNAGETFSEREGLLVLEGLYLCREMIGRIRQEQMGENGIIWNES